MKIAQISTIVAAAALLALPAFAADTTSKVDSKPEAKATAPAKTCTKKACTHKTGKAKKASKVAK